MLWREEVIFIEDLFNAIDYLGVKRIHGNFIFHNGAVNKLKDYLEKELPRDYENVSTIFATENLTGNYSRFREAVKDSGQIHIHSPFEGFIYINKRQKDPDKKFIGLAKKFCDFAEIEY